MSDDEDDDVEREKDDARLIELLAAMDFADRYYAMCEAHSKRGPEMPLQRQRVALAKTGRAFTYDKREKFFAHKDPDAPKGRRLGVHVALELAMVELVLVFETKNGHIAGPFASLARKVKMLSIPGYKHSPPYPKMDFASQAALDKALAAGLALYDDVKAVILAEPGWGG
jgi:hypothetical protein